MENGVTADYLDEDGCLHCGICGKRKQMKVSLMGFEHVVSCLCECEVKARQELDEKMQREEAQRLLYQRKSVGLRERRFWEWKFENDNGSNQKIIIARQYVENWIDMKRKNVGLLLMGPVGTGKSFFAGCIANALLEQGERVMMTNFSRILNEMTSYQADKNQIIQNLVDYPLLIIDDLGIERNSEFALEQVYNVIDSRYCKMLPLIVTTNLGLNEMKSTDLDTAHQRIYSRILEMCVPIYCGGEDIDKEELYNYESTMIIGAGSFPGLSGILPVWIRKEQQESEIRRVNIFAGGNEHITASACADFLLSTFSQFGKIDSYYSHQQIKKTENITERVPLIFPDTAEIMEYLPDEIYLSAEYSRIDELHWYNVQTNSEYRNIIQEALLKLMISQEYEYVNRLAENVKRKLENKREESKTWYRIWLEIETVTEKKNYGYEALDSYKINGRIAAFCAEALCSGICQKGIYWPFEILDAEIVMNSLINEEILIGLKENDKKMQEHDLNYEEGEL